MRYLFSIPTIALPTLALFLCSLGMSAQTPSAATGQTSPPPVKTHKPSKHRSPGGDVGSGTGDIGKGAAKGTGAAAEGVGKGAGDLVTLHPIGAATDVGKGAGVAGKDVGVGAVKGTGKIAKGTGRGIGKIFHHGHQDDTTTPSPERQN
ncbi:hypothetical protein GCM10011585_18290 [Edaphobacter dinghuensis]|uniref:Uncharacterized protein n=1 Tax=Edaphobacter dinghuensis TaxID=1560005 RepID=A0A917HDI9_9BACT|nr:hypothetical protein GCM10011585_18290 [Edaphobacter dinghuensis]